MKSLITTTLFPALISASFSLDVSGPDWDYTTSDLLNTTSQACKDAYSASIDCPDTLVGLVASMRPAFSPGSSDLDAVCTDTCKNSLDTWIENVKSACSASGDKAKESLGGACDPCKFTYDPVEIVGQVFQYTWAKDCSKDSSGEYCYFSDESYAGSDFDCDDECSIAMFTAVHDNPEGSSKEFNYYYLVSQSDWWLEEFGDGWETVEQCEGITDDDSSSTAAAATSTTATGPSHTITLVAPQKTGESSASNSSSTTSTATSVSRSGSATKTASAENSGSRFEWYNSMLAVLVGLCIASSW